MALSKIQSESVNLADNFAFTGTVTGAGEAGLVPLSTVTVSSATANITFDNLSTDYDTYMFFIEIHPSTDSVSLYSRFLNSSGVEINGNSNYGYYLDQDGTGLSSNGTFSMRLSNSMGADSYEGYRGVLTLQGRNYAVDTSVKPPQVSGTYSISNTSTTLVGGAFYGGLNASAVTAIRGYRFFVSTGNIEKGKISIYGVTQP